MCVQELSFRIHFNQFRLVLELKHSVYKMFFLKLSAGNGLWVPLTLANIERVLRH